MGKYKFSIKTLWPLVFITIVSCSSSRSPQSSSVASHNSSPISHDTESKDASENSLSSGGSVDTKPSTSGSKSLTPLGSNNPTLTTVATNNGQSEQQRNASTTTLVSDTTSTTEPSRFLSFGCTVTARDLANPAPAGSKALEIQVRTSGPTTGGIWLETTSPNFRKRSSIKLDTSGDGRTVHFVPDGTTTEVLVYASYTFEPSSMMCRTSN
ncbi:unannotated protein [freshwater metagenome]|uniref:Unannotated protein n=1 Tax=freshwater metagenome TaxID=449393 RepID=A0A6J6H7C1_9ZZZZ